MQREHLFSSLLLPSIVCVALIVASTTSSRADNAPPAMSVPGQFNVGPMGAATYVVPISVPPGTAGMVPSLSLNYSSQNGDGIVGLGWMLSGLPTIGRCPRTLAQDKDGSGSPIHGSVNYDAGDRFCMEGQRLVAISGNYGVDHTVYRTEIDGFDKIVSYGTAGTGPSYFKVWTKAGQIMEFGANANSRALAVGKPEVRVWAVNKISDTVGNYLTVTYNDEAGTDRTVNGEIYPLEVDYTGNSRTAQSTHNSVQFGYNLARVDVTPTYQAGSLQKTTILLNEIQTYANGTEVYDYKLDYGTSGTISTHSELKSVKLCDNSGSNCLNQSTFGWQGTKDVVTLPASPTSTMLSVGSNIEATVLAGDFNGDGLTDVLPSLRTDGCDVYLGTQTPTWGFAAGGYTAHYTWYEIDPNDPHHARIHHAGNICFPYLQVPGFSTFDLDGDGFSDVTMEAAQNRLDINEGRIFLRNSRSGDLTADGVQPIFVWPIVQVGDFNGDGRTDLFGGGNEDAFYISNGTTTFSEHDVGTGLSGIFATHIPSDFDGDGCADLMIQGANYTAQVFYSQFCAPRIPSVSVSNWVKDGYTITLGDFNGDGKTDVLRTGNGDCAELLLSTGTSIPGTGTCTSVAGVDISKYSIYTGDFNGDGKTDLLLIADGIDFGNVHHYAVGSNAYIMLSTGNDASGYGFVNKATIASLGVPGTDDPFNHEFPLLRTVISDWNSDGAADIWIMKPSGDLIYPVTFTPELINSVSNGIGATTAVQYNRLNQNGGVYTKCATSSTFNCGDTYPVQGVNGPLYVVTEVDSSTGLVDGSLFKSSYSYGQAKADLSGRGFLGFAQMSVTDLQTHIVQTTTYGTIFPLTGLITSQTKVCPATICATAQVTLNSTTNTYETVSLGTGTDGVARDFVGLQQTVVTANDADGSPLPTATTLYDYDCDHGSACAGTTPTGYGNALTVTQTTAMPDGSDSSTKTTTNAYDNDVDLSNVDGRWLLGRLRTANVRSVTPDSDITRQTAYTYDTGASTSTGLLMSEVVEPNNTTCNSDGTTGTPVACKLETDYGYDNYGNKTSAVTTGLGAVLSGGSQVLQSTTRTTTALFFDATNDPYSQFLYQATNAANESEFWFHANSFGLPSKHTGPNGLDTTWLYDTFGRKTREHRPDSTETQFSYAYCTSHVCGAFSTTAPDEAAFAMLSTPTKNDHATQIGPQSIVYYDSLYRVIATDVQGFGNKWIRAQTAFDALGHVSKTSRPYFRDVVGVAIYWTINTVFDPLGRVLTATNPYYLADNTLTTNSTTFVYDGLTSSMTQHIREPDGTTTNETTTTLKNARGLAVSVTNALSKVTTYSYDAVGDLVLVTDSSNNVTRNTYDVRGHKITAQDPDMGHWVYAYDAFGELYQQTDAKSQLATLSYDPLGRAVKRSEIGLTSFWTYGTDPALHNIDKLINACADTCAGSDYVRTLTYDSFGRPKTVTLNIAGGTAAVYTLTYDNPTGRMATLKYPSGLKVQYNYDATLGYLTSITDFSTPTTTYWTANDRDAEMHLTASTAGDGVAMVNTYNAATGLAMHIGATAPGGTQDGLANFSYMFDSNGTLISRTDLVADGSTTYTENFCYDRLNRVTNASIADPGTTDCHTGRTGQVKAYAYDDLGSIMSKSDVGTYTYPTSGPTAVRPHAVSSVAGTVNGIINPKYDYDANGNMTCEYTGPTCTFGTGSGRTTVTWSSFNMVSAIVQGTTNLGLTYDTEHARITQHVVAGSVTTDTTYLNDPMSGAMSEKVVSGGTTTWHDYLMADGHMVAEHFKTGANESWNYFILDHLGSVSIITSSDGMGGVVVAANGRLSYDAWGRMRNANGSDDTTCSKPAVSPTTRGFTGQEEMPSVCLINFNARVYDPTLGKFMSPDSVTQSVYDMQLLNRYSYVGNNPLSFTDPTGNVFGIDDAIIVAALVVTAVIAPKVALQLLPIAGELLCGPVCAGLGAAAAAGIQGGDSTQVLFAFVLTTMTAGALQGIANAPVGSWSVPQALAAGVVGGTMSFLGGGHFGSGFLAAGFSMFTSPLAGDIGGGDEIGGRLVSAVLGGAASVLGGGKFANGALTGAFAYAASTDPELAERRTSSGATPYESGNDAPIDLNHFPGVTKCGNSLCGNVPVSCAGTTAQCNNLMGKLRTYSAANAFKLTFSNATGWQIFASYFVGGVVYPNFYDALPVANHERELGSAGTNNRGNGIMNLYGADWMSANSNVVAHEFSHVLGVDHNGAGPTLMFKYDYNTSIMTLQPNERKSLVDAYGH